MPVHVISTCQRRIHPEAIGRQAPCPCGSGRKYKRCCLRGDKDRRRRSRGRARP